MLSSLFIGPTAALVDEVLGQVDGRVAVVDAPKLARALAERGRDVLAVCDDARALKRLRDTAVRATAASLPLTDASFAAVVGVGAGTADHWEERIREWSRAVVDGGVVILVDRAPAAELTRRALCAGLMDIRQRAAGRMVATRGLAPKLPTPAVPR